MNQEKQVDKEKVRAQIASTAGKLGALARQTAPDYNPHKATEAARSASWQKRLDKVDPEHRMSEAERNRAALSDFQASMHAGRLKRLQSQLKRTTKGSTHNAG